MATIKMKKVDADGNVLRESDIHKDEVQNMLDAGWVKSKAEPVKKAPAKKKASKKKAK